MIYVYIHTYIHTCMHAYIYMIHTHGHTRLELEQLGATFHGGDHLIAYPWGDFIHCPSGNYGCKRTPSDERTDYMSPVSLSISLARALSLYVCGQGGVASTSDVKQVSRVGVM
jgi:hypothetical protein